MRNPLLRLNHHPNAQQIYRPYYDILQIFVAYNYSAFLKDLCSSLWQLSFPLPCLSARMTSVLYFSSFFQYWPLFTYFYIHSTSWIIAPPWTRISLPSSPRILSTPGAQRLPWPLSLFHRQDASVATRRAILLSPDRIVRISIYNLLENCSLFRRELMLYKALNDFSREDISLSSLP